MTRGDRIPFADCTFMLLASVCVYGQTDSLAWYSWCPISQNCIEIRSHTTQSRASRLTMRNALHSSVSLKLPLHSSLVLRNSDIFKPTLDGEEPSTLLKTAGATDSVHQQHQRVLVHCMSGASKWVFESILWHLCSTACRLLLSVGNTLEH